MQIFSSFKPFRLLGMAFLLPLVLAGCNKSEKEVEAEINFMESKLPVGCKIIDVGNYTRPGFNNGTYPLIAIICPNAQVTTITSEKDCGGRYRHCIDRELGIYTSN